VIYSDLSEPVDLMKHIDIMYFFYINNLLYSFATVFYTVLM